MILLVKYFSFQPDELYILLYLIYFIVFYDFADTYLLIDIFVHNFSIHKLVLVLKLYGLLCIQSCIYMYIHKYTCTHVFIHSFSYLFIWHSHAFKYLITCKKYMYTKTYIKTCITTYIHMNSFLCEYVYVFMFVYEFIVYLFVNLDLFMHLFHVDWYNKMFGP